ncbi:hypothetical protein QN362_16315 [Actimicrobium sp. CCC2.4]|uniref:hypothetical protein n=1 Tax=Actimicrobium sp. CCC2.4 TaxID=3048606 RepID=UPI002AC8CA3E|nr:hypothetical protein [Actimicrobium sp. CCC2.4]MEB0136901.1 hypothetical protein [Actimicrobium sp. CCC2.4]WPX33451.1 hypothetical protein RHM62_06335 [Actimicrobium sp. CCC2.4]
MSATIALEAARAGMVLGAAVADASGNTLLPQGVLLTEALLASLRRRGIGRVQINDELPAPVARSPAPSPEAVTARIDFIFRHTSGSASAGLRATMLAQALRDAR